MANYYTLARTNYFTVKNFKEFEEWAHKRYFEVVEHRDNKNTYALLGDYEGNGFIYNEAKYDCEEDDFVYDENGYEIYEEVNIATELAEHLADANVAILTQVGHEKLRFVDGISIAVNNKGETKIINLNDIYKQALKLGNVTNRAVY